MNTHPSPRPLTGALTGTLLTIGLIALFFLGDQVAGLPFIPFDVFDWLARVLPGDVITAGINLLVTFIMTFELGQTSSTAKIIEQGMGIVIVIMNGAILGAILFAVMRHASTTPRRYLVGGGVGTMAGSMMALISTEVNQTATADPIISTGWVLIAFTAWGVGMSWIYDDLIQIPESTPETTGASQINRRQFLVRIGGATATITLAGTGLGVLLGENRTQTTLDTDVPDAEKPFPGGPLPNADAALVPAPGTRAEYPPLDEHYQVDINTRPPVIDIDEWRLQVTGMIREPLELSLNDLIDNYEHVDQYVTLSCVSNPIGGDLIGTTRWTGIPLTTLIDDWNLEPRASHLKITGADGFDEWVEIRLARLDRRVMLAFAWDGELLRERHGSPLRIYIPNRYGMKQPKWIMNIEAVDAWGEGYWVRRGWSETALVQATSVIDTVAVDHAYEQDGQTFIPIGGIAYSGARRISKVEVRIGNGDWEETELRDSLSDTTWVIWRYDWPFEAGTHVFRVRCYDGNDIMQTEQYTPTHPDGSTGIHSRRADIPEEPGAV